MPRLRVSQRLRGRLKKLLAPYGSQTSLADWSQKRPGGTKISQQELSYFLNETEGRRGITIDDLDDIADYFEISIGELVGDTKASELSPPETRLLHAFRALPEQYQEHLIAFVELASIAPKIHFPLPRPHQAGINTAVINTSHPTDSMTVGDRHVSHQTKSAELEHLRTIVGAIRDALTAPAEDPAVSTGTDPVPARQVSGTRPHKTRRSKLADRLR